MEALATYEQRFGGVRRRFALLPDHLQVQGRRFGSSFEVRHDLASLSMHFDHARVFAPLFYGGLVLIGTALVGVIILAFNGDLIWPALAVVGLIALSGVVSVALRARPLRVFMFKFKDGQYAFEVVGAGPEAFRVEQFVSQVAEQMQKTRGETGAPQSTTSEAR